MRPLRRFKPSNLSYGAYGDASSLDYPTIKANASLGIKIDQQSGCAVTAVCKALQTASYNGKDASVFPVNPQCDVVFGPKLEAEIKKFQQAKGLSVDGVVGPQTYAALGLTGRTSTTTTEPIGAGPGEEIPEKEDEGTDWRKIALIGIPAVLILGVGTWLAFSGSSE